MFGGTHASFVETYVVGHLSYIRRPSVGWPAGRRPDDHASLVHLNEPCLLDSTARRYAKDLIYTATGRILVAVNPFTPLDIYGPEAMAAHHVAGARPGASVGAGGEGAAMLKPLLYPFPPPHRNSQRPAVQRGAPGGKHSAASPLMARA